MLPKCVVDYIEKKPYLWEGIRMLSFDEIEHRVSQWMGKKRFSIL